jgi:hypothetical protein
VVQGGGGLFLMSEVPLYTLSSDLAAHRVGASLEARATVGSLGGAFSYKRGTPVEGLAGPSFPSHFRNSLTSEVNDTCRRSPISPEAGPSRTRSSQLLAGAECTLAARAAKPASCRGAFISNLLHTMHSLNGFRKSTPPQNLQLVVSISKENN